MARTSYMTLVHFVEQSERSSLNGTVFGYIPIDETCGKDVPLFAYAGCASSSQPVFIVVVRYDQRTPFDGVRVVGYYDVSSEIYTEWKLDPSLHRLDVRGSEHGRYLHNGFPPGTVPAWWPIVTLCHTQHPMKALHAIRRARAVIVASRSVVASPKLVHALRRRMLNETIRSQHPEVYRRTQAILQQLASDTDTEMHMHDEVQPFVSRFPFGRVVPSVCYEAPAFLEQPVLQGRASPHRVIHERMGR